MFKDRNWIRYLLWGAEIVGPVAFLVLMFKIWGGFGLINGLIFVFGVYAISFIALLAIREYELNQ